MKFITYESEGVKAMVLFDDEETHALVALRLGIEPISAGYIKLDLGHSCCLEVECYGESTTLGLTPEEEDTILLRKLLNL